MKIIRHFRGRVYGINGLVIRIRIRVPRAVIGFVVEFWIILVGEEEV
jgi:hypothetical protein